MKTRRGPMLNRRRPGQARPRPEHRCIGCGRRLVRFRWTYCRLCKWRVEHDIPVDYDDVPTARERKRMVGC